MTKNVLITKIMDLVTSIQNVTAILNPWTTILESMFDVIAPVINEVLAPIVGALKSSVRH